MNTTEWRIWDAKRQGLYALATLPENKELAREFLAEVWADLSQNCPKTATRKLMDRVFAWDGDTLAEWSCDTFENVLTDLVEEFYAPQEYSWNVRARQWTRQIDLLEWMLREKYRSKLLGLLFARARAGVALEQKPAFEEALFQ